MKRKLLFSILACIIIIVPLMVSCGGGDDSDEVFTVAMQTNLEQLNPITGGGGSQNGPIFCNIFDPLVAWTTEGEPTSGLGITSWEILEDGEVFEFTVREGVTFQSGDALTAWDIEFTIDELLEKNTEMQSWMRTFDKMEVIDEYTIKIYFTEPNVLFIPDTATQIYIVSKDYYERVGEDTFSRQPVGTGPYQFVDYKVGQYIDLEVYPDYWGEEPEVKKARILFASDPTTRVAMLQAGEVDMITDTPWERVGDLEDDGFNIEQVCVTPAIVVQFDTLNPDTPWYDPKVRQAIAYAIDREAIVNNLFYGIPNIYAWLAPGEVGYDPDLDPYPYDLEKARQLLEEAGYADGFDMPLYYFVNANVSGLDQVTDYLASGLTQLGINCETVGYEFAEMMNNIMEWHTDTTAEVVIVAAPAVDHDTDPSAALNRNLYYAEGGSLYNNPAIDALIEEALRTVDDTARGELIREAYQIINEDLPLVPILSNVSVYAMQSDIEFTPTQKSFRMMFLKDVSYK